MFKNKYEIKEVRVYEEDGSYFLYIKYVTEDDRLVQELEIPKIDLCLKSNAKHPNIEYNSGYPSIEYTHINSMEDEFCYLYNGLGARYRMFPGTTSEANHVFYTVKTLKEKTHKMTKSEIEAKLGYKIEIVSEKEK